MAVSADNPTQPAAGHADTAVVKFADWLTYDQVAEVLTIDGVQYARDLFKHFAASPLEISFRIINRTHDGAVTIAQDRHPLAAAAPDMLAAIQQYLALVADVPNTLRISKGDMDERRAAFRASVAKATGAASPPSVPGVQCHA